MEVKVRYAFKIYGKGTAYGGMLQTVVKPNDKMVIVSDGGSECHATLGSIQRFAGVLEQGKKGEEVGLFFPEILPTDGRFKIYKIVEAEQPAIPSSSDTLDGSIE